MNKKSHLTLIDMTIMHGIFGSNTIAMREYIESFIHINSALVEKIESAIKEKNTKLTHDYFHQLKGPVGSIGFKKMYKLCEKIESEIAQSNWDVAATHCLDIKKLLQQLQDEANKEFKADSTKD